MDTVTYHLSRIVVALHLGAGVRRTDVEVLGNVLMVMPVGLLAAIAWPRVSLARILIVCVLASVGIELAQFVLLPGRYPSIRDVVLNAVGAAVGASLARLIAMRAVRSPAAAPR